MQRTAPSLGQLALIAFFVISCFGLLTYLWVTFGGPTPLKPQGYEFNVPFDEAAQLAEQTDVRISGVSVGKVQKIELSPDKRRAMATIEIDSAQAPVPSDTRAILRAKTLLGEAYVELTPADGEGPKLPEGGTLPVAQVAPVVKLDEILRALDEPTRAAFRTWMQDAAVAIRGRGEDLGYAIAEFQPTFGAFDEVFRTLDTQSAAVRQLFSNGRATFSALRGRQGELRGLIGSANEVFGATGRANDELAEAFRAFPTFLDESKATVERLKTFSEDSDPLMRQLIPASRELSPVLGDIGRAAPQFRRFFGGLKPVAKRAPRGFAAFREMLDQDFPPLLVALDPFLRSLNPILNTVDRFDREVSSLFANATAATNGVLPGASGQQAHYLRSLAVMAPESLATYPNRLRSNRNNAYVDGGGYRIPNLTNFHTAQCAGGATATLDPDTPNDPAFNARTDGDAAAARAFFDRLKEYAFADKLSSDQVPAPACGKQALFPPTGASGPATDFPHVLRQR